jgi:hypothetical protein
MRITFPSLPCCEVARIPHLVKARSAQGFFPETGMARAGTIEDCMVMLPVVGLGRLLSAKKVRVRAFNNNL